jgi:putative peptidoglycan lipid II flippase
MIKGLLASGVMAGAVSGIAILTQPLPPLVQVIVAGSAGVFIYALLAMRLRLEAATFFVETIRRRLHRSH